MKHYEDFNSKSDLLAYRDYCRDFWAKEFGYQPKREFLVNEKVASFIQAKDWNTAIAFASKDEITAPIKDVVNSSVTKTVDEAQNEIHDSVTKTADEDIEILLDKTHPLGSAFVGKLPDGSFKVGKYKVNAQIFATARLAYDYFLPDACDSDHGAWNICYILEDYLDDDQD